MKYDHTDDDLEALADQMLSGRFELWQVPSWALTIWDAGFYFRDPEVRGLQQQVRYLDDEADSLYERLYNPGRDLAEIRQRRIDQALDEADAAGELHGEGDVLRVAVGAIRLRRRAA